MKKSASRRQPLSEDRRGELGHRSRRRSNPAVGEKRFGEGERRVGEVDPGVRGRPVIVVRARELGEARGHALEAGRWRQRSARGREGVVERIDEPTRRCGEEYVFAATRDSF
jgi:hypothetical protein